MATVPCAKSCERASGSCVSAAGDSASSPLGPQFEHASTGGTCAGGEHAATKLLANWHVNVTTSTMCEKVQRRGQVIIDNVSIMKRLLLSPTELRGSRDATHVRG